MAIKRAIEEVDITQAFFPVEERPVGIEPFFGNFKSIPGYKAIVDSDLGTAISIVSKDYQLITNRDAYEIAVRLIPKLFEGKTINDFIPYNVRIANSKGSCIIDLIIPTGWKNLFGDKKESYTPFIRIWNSYNRTYRLKFEIGFCRWICLNGSIFGEIDFKFSATHTKRHLGFCFDDIVEQGAKRLINVKKAWHQFELKLSKGKEIAMPQSLILAMFCRAFNIIVDPHKITSQQKQTLAKQAEKLIANGKEYFEELGNNGYAMFNVLTDFASYPPAYSFNMNNYQHMAGKWLSDIVDAYEKADFKLSEFIGKYLDTSAYLESLISCKGKDSTTKL